MRVVYGTGPRARRSALRRSDPESLNAEGRRLLWEAIRKYREGSIGEVEQARIDIECLLIGTPYERPRASDGSR